MSYTGTVRCQHCYAEGHNRRGCPQLKERMEKRLVADPDDWQAKRYFEKKKGAKIRKCTFCKEQGHNKATCPNLKNAKSTWTAANGKFREVVLNYFKDVGLTIGALVEVPRVYVGGDTGYLDDCVGVITSINWDEINIDNWDGYAPNCLTIKTVGQVQQELELAPCPPQSAVLPLRALKWSSHRGGAKVVSEGSGSHGFAPEGWTSGSVSKSKMKNVIADDSWGQHYDYGSGEYVNDTCNILLSVAKWETLVEETKKHNKENE